MMRRLLLVRVTLVLVFVLGLAAVWAAQIGDGVALTAKSSLYELRSMESPERRAELVTGLEKLTDAQAKMFNAFLYGGMVLVGLVCLLFYLVKPMRPET